jgi:hypothetical protein
LTASLRLTGLFWDGGQCQWLIQTRSPWQFNPETCVLKVQTKESWQMATAWWSQQTHVFISFNVPLWKTATAL